MIIDKATNGTSPQRDNKNKLFPSENCLDRTDCIDSIGFNPPTVTSRIKIITDGNNIPVSSINNIFFHIILFILIFTLTSFNGK